MGYNVFPSKYNKIIKNVKAWSIFFSSSKLMCRPSYCNLLFQINGCLGVYLPRLMRSLKTDWRPLDVLKDFRCCPLINFCTCLFLQILHHGEDWFIHASAIDEDQYILLPFLKGWDIPPATQPVVNRYLLSSLWKFSFSVSLWRSFSPIPKFAFFSKA